MTIEVREMDLADRYLNTQCVRQDRKGNGKEWRDFNDLRKIYDPKHV